MESGLFRYFIVQAVTQNQPAKVSAFLATLDLSSCAPDWLPWAAVPYLVAGSGPSFSSATSMAAVSGGLGAQTTAGGGGIQQQQPPVPSSSSARSAASAAVAVVSSTPPFDTYFSPTWATCYAASLRNLLERAVAAMPPPRLLAFHADRVARRALALDLERARDGERFWRARAAEIAAARSHSVTPLPAVSGTPTATATCGPLRRDTMGASSSATIATIATIATTSTLGSPLTAGATASVSSITAAGARSTPPQSPAATPLLAALSLIAPTPPAPAPRTLVASSILSDGGGGASILTDATIASRAGNDEDETDEYDEPFLVLEETVVPAPSSQASSTISDGRASAETVGPVPLAVSHDGAWVACAAPGSGLVRAWPTAGVSSSSSSSGGAIRLAGGAAAGEVVAVMWYDQRLVAVFASAIRVLHVPTRSVSETQLTTAFESGCTVAAASATHPDAFASALMAVAGPHGLAIVLLRTMAVVASVPLVPPPPVAGADPQQQQQQARADHVCWGPPADGNASGRRWIAVCGTMGVSVFDWSPETSTLSFTRIIDLPHQLPRGGRVLTAFTCTSAPPSPSSPTDVPPVRLALVVAAPVQQDAITDNADAMKRRLFNLRGRQSHVHLVVVDVDAGVVDDQLSRQLAVLDDLSASTVSTGFVPGAACVVPGWVTGASAVPRTIADDAVPLPIITGGDNSSAVQQQRQRPWWLVVGRWVLALTSSSQSGIGGEEDGALGAVVVQDLVNGSSQDGGDAAAATVVGVACGRGLIALVRRDGGVRLVRVMVAAASG
ncbi:hypothetical protein BC828DRAFT_20234 [Blastocladiella britannica]|nr:hypothetical protein BC828DRAFT_20234 [Blastocladiella britannica]